MGQTKFFVILDQFLPLNPPNSQDRLQISGLHFTICESDCKALFHRNNKNAKLSISFLAPKFHLVTIIFKQDNILQKNLISWHDLILQLHRQANFGAVYLTSFMFYVLIFLYFSITLFCISEMENSEAVFVCLLCTLNILVYCIKVLTKICWIFWSNKYHRGGEHKLIMHSIS